MAPHSNVNLHANKKKPFVPRFRGHSRKNRVTHPRSLRAPGPRNEGSGSCRADPFILTARRESCSTIGTFSVVDVIDAGPCGGNVRSGLSVDRVFAGLSTRGTPTAADCGEAADNSDIAWFGPAAHFAAASATELAADAASLVDILSRLVPAKSTEATAGARDVDL